jgi:hypothetical protein
VTVACGTCGEWRGTIRVVVGKPEGKRPLGRPGFKWEDNINIYLKNRLGKRWLDWSDSGNEHVAGYPGRGNELSVSINITKLLE